MWCDQQEKTKEKDFKAESRLDKQTRMRRKTIEITIQTAIQEDEDLYQQDTDNNDNFLEFSQINKLLELTAIWVYWFTVCVPLFPLVRFVGPPTNINPLPRPVKHRKLINYSMSLSRSSLVHLKEEIKQFYKPRMCQVRYCTIFCWHFIPSGFG